MYKLRFSARSLSRKPDVSMLFPELAWPWLVSSTRPWSWLSYQELEVQHIAVNDHRQPVDSDDIGAPYLVTVPGLAVLSRELQDVNNPTLSSLHMVTKVTVPGLYQNSLAPTCFDIRHSVSSY